MDDCSSSSSEQSGKNQSSSPKLSDLRGQDFIKGQFYEKKQLEQKCPVCEIDDHQNKQFIICDRCDDAYHLECLLIDKVPEDQVWICGECRKQMEISRQEEENRPQRCSKCTKKLSVCDVIEVEQYNEESGLWQIKQSEIRIKDEEASLKCRYCQRYFHNSCFSKRKNSLNCSSCQKQIRQKCPQSHEQWVAWMQLNHKKVQDSGYLKLSSCNLEEYGITTRNSLQNFKPFDVSGDWQLVCRAQMSIYYAIQTCRLTFCNSQMYQNMEVLALNKSSNHQQQMRMLSKKDEMVFQKVLLNYHKNLVPCIEVKENRKLGFYVEATKYIETLTIICEYCGEVCISRNSSEKNDSVFRLVVTEFSKKSLDIAPQKFSNIARFISGVDKSQKHLENVKALLFCHRGRSRIIFYTSKPIERGEILFLDYNAGIYEQYPTQNFVNNK